jgi:hypothetical protein
MSALEKRIAALEAKSRKRVADKPSGSPFGALAVYEIASGKKGARGRWRCGKESVLAAYARRAGYADVADLLAVAANDPTLFAKRHVRQKPPWVAAEDIEAARVFVLAPPPTGPVTLCPEAEELLARSEALRRTHVRTSPDRHWMGAAVNRRSGPAPDSCAAKPSDQWKGIASAASLTA